MKLVCSSKCNPERNEIVGFRLVGVPITVNEDLTIDMESVRSAIVNICKGLIPGAKVLCGRCYAKAIIEE